ncbi:response regulator transcription factor [Enterococcus sp. LJL51]|uniref:response regulator transcription factor n=1 Tax=Enterococcus sp. LJL51 TaxID=3416656 RepID=UPI003CEB27A7
MKQKLLIIDDEIDLVETLKRYFELSGYLVYTAGNGAEGLQLLNKKPDLILLDVNMPEMDGLDFCRAVREVIHVPIIFLSARVDQTSRMEGLVAGGDDYLLKPFSMEELGLRIQAHLRREARGGREESVAYFGQLAVLYQRKEIRCRNQIIPLTRTEFEIAAYLSLRKGKVFSKEQIYEHLWGFDKEGDSGIITEHIRRIRAKIGKVYPEEIIETVWGLGYKWIG